MRIGRFIFILLLLCSLVAQVTGEQRTLARGSEHHFMSPESSCRDDNIDSFNFVDENLFDEIEEVEESEQQNEKKARKHFCRKLFASEQAFFGYTSKYYGRKIAAGAGKYNTSQGQHMILLL
jgi:hypothetical protein